MQLRLNALLITPVQRIPRYKMLLEDVIKNTPDCHPDKKSLKEALEQIDALAWHINEQVGSGIYVILKFTCIVLSYFKLREHEDSLRMLDIQRSLVGNCPKIISPGRKLVRQGNLMKVPRAGGAAQSRYLACHSFKPPPLYEVISQVLYPLLRRHNVLQNQNLNGKPGKEFSDYYLISSTCSCRGQECQDRLKYHRIIVEYFLSIVGEPGAAQVQLPGMRPLLTLEDHICGDPRGKGRVQGEPISLYRNSP